MSVGEIIALIKAFGGGSGGGSSGGGVLVVHQTASGTVITLDKTFKQIEGGMTSGGVVIVDEVSGSSTVDTRIVTGVYKDSGVYEVSSSAGITYSADSEDGYPYTDFG